MRDLTGKVRIRFGNVPFYYKVLSSQICLILLIVGIVGIGFITFIKTTMKTNEEKHLYQLLGVVNGDITSQMKQFSVMALDMAISSEIRENLNQTDSVQYSRAQAAITSVLEDKIVSHNQIQNVMIVDAENHVYTTNELLLLPESFDLQETEVYRQTQEHPGNLVWLTENDIFDEYGISIYSQQISSDINAAMAIKNYKTGELLGILIITLQKDFFRNQNYTESGLEGVHLFMVSEENKKIYPIAETEESLSTEQQECLTDVTMAGEIIVLADQMLLYQYNEMMEWKLVSVMDMDLFNSSLRQMVIIGIIVLSAALFLSVIISRKLSYLLTGDINRLVSSMEQVEEGNFNVVIENDRQDELGKLFRSFNKMVRRIDELIISRYQQEILTKEAEFRTLQAQINPHFLYNMLDMLKWKLIAVNQEELSKNVVAIASLFRYSITSDRDTVRLSDEIANIKDYLEVQFAISEKEINVSIQIEDGDKILLPKLSLQPLAENTIIHGFEGKQRGNLLKILGEYSEKKRYRLQIEDNGMGMTDEKLNYVRNGGISSEGHVGISNVRERICHLYGEGSEFKMESEYGFGTKITIELPIKDVEPDESDYY